MKAERNQRTLWTIPFLIAVCLIGLPAQAKYGGGTGEPNDPFLIYTAAQMNEIGLREQDWDKHFALAADVNLADCMQQQFHPIGTFLALDDPNNRPFTGLFDGRHRRILNFTWSSTGCNCVGLFRCLGEDGCIRNLRLTNVDVNVPGTDCVGTLVARNEGMIADCNTTGRVRGNELIGTLVGENYGTLDDCRSAGDIHAVAYAGGLAGVNYGTMTACRSAGSILGNSSLGGLVGGNHGTIIACYSTATITGTLRDVGGLAGFNSKTITDCHSTGWAWAGQCVGGLVGSNTGYGTLTNCWSGGGASGHSDIGGLAGGNFGTIVRCYSTAIATASLGDLGGLVGTNSAWIADCYSTGWAWGGRHAGGLVGSNTEYGTVLNCYCSGGATGYSDVGGLAGANKGTITNSFWDTQASGLRTSAGGIAKTTAELQLGSTYLNAGWDLAGETANGEENIWWIDEGKDYPRLCWEPAAHPNVAAEQ